MNRAEKRKQARKNKRQEDKKVQAMRWISSLPPEKLELVNYYARIMSEREHGHMLRAINRSITAAVIEFTDLSMEEVGEIVTLCGEFMTEDGEVMMRNKANCGGDIDMAINKVNGMNEAVEARVRELLVGEVKQKEAVEVLKAEFPMLSKAMVTNGYKRVKEKVKEETLANEKALAEKLGAPGRDIDECLEYIFGENEEIYDDSDKTNHKAHGEELKQFNDNAPKVENKAITSENNANKKGSKLKVIDEAVKVVSRTVQGEYARYHIENKVVNVDDEYAFGGINEVESWLSEEQKDVLEKIEALKEKLYKLDQKAGEILEVIKSFM